MCEHLMLMAAHCSEWKLDSNSLWANNEVHVPVCVGRQKLRGYEVGVGSFRVHSISKGEESCAIIIMEV